MDQSRLDPAADICVLLFAFPSFARATAYACTNTAEEPENQVEIEFRRV